MTYVSLVQFYKYLFYEYAEHLSIVNKFNIIKFLGNLFNQSDYNFHLSVKMSHPNTYSSKTRSRQLVLAVLLLTLWLSCSAGLAQTIELGLGDNIYEIELAKTPQQRQRGLMYRQHLAPRQGMLLVYPQAGDHRIWMKNMRIPLWVYWIDENFIVVGMQRLQPCSESPCRVYSVPGDTQYILELGDYEHRLEPGDKIEGISGF